MLIQVCLLLLSAGVYASHAGGDSEPITDEEFFGQLDFVFPENFLSRFPEESVFFRLKIFVYLFFNIFSKYLGENEPMKLWSNFNENDYSRVAIDALFYEYLSKFTDKKLKPLVFNPLESYKSIPEDIAIDRIGNYLDSISEDQVTVVQSATGSQTPSTEKYSPHDADCAKVQIPTFGTPGKDFPNYCHIPKTSFTCANKLVPGIYADMETSCQVFHVCWLHRMDSFLCPIGSTFNQELLTCDFWHESDCASSPLFFDKSPFGNSKTPRNTEPSVTVEDDTLTTTEIPSVSTPEQDFAEYDGTCQSLISIPLQSRMKFLPAKCEVTRLTPIASKKTTRSSKLDEKLHSQQVADILSRSIRDLLALMIDAAKIGSRAIPKLHVAVQRSKLGMNKQAFQLHPRYIKAAAEFTSKSGEMGSDEERMRRSPREFSDPPPQRTNSRFEKDSLLNAPSEGSFHSSTLPPPVEPPQRQNSRYAKYTLSNEDVQETESSGRSVRSASLKPSKSLEDSKKRVFAIVVRTIELVVDILHDKVLPFIETFVIDYEKKPKSKNV